MQIAEKSTAITIRQLPIDQDDIVIRHSDCFPRRRQITNGVKNDAMLREGRSQRIRHFWIVFDK
ncbi:hypothetical protein D3C80_1746040 [compost metagenome]